MAHIPALCNLSASPSSFAGPAWQQRCLSRTAQPCLEEARPQEYQGLRVGGGEPSGAASWRPVPAVAICKISDALFLSALLLFAQATQRECDADDRPDIRRTNSLQKILNVAKEAESAVEDLFKRPETLQQTADLLTKLFPLWIFGAVVLGLFAPKTVTWLQGHGVTICVGATMVFTGMTLDTDDFVRILQQPSQVAMGVMCQYTVMPLAGFVIARVLQLQSDVAAGLILLLSLIHI